MIRHRRDGIQAGGGAPEPPSPASRPDLPVDPARESAAARLWMTHASRAQAQDRVEAALESWTLACEAWERLAEIQDPAFEALRGQAWLGRARAWQSAGNPGKALADCRRAGSLLRSLRVLDRRRAVPALAAVLVFLGELLALRGSDRLALESFDEALELLGTPDEAGSAEPPAAGPEPAASLRFVPTPRALLADAAAGRGAVLARQGRLGPALRALDHCLKLREAEAVSGEPLARLRLAFAFESLGWVHRHAGNTGPALTSFQRAVSVLRSVDPRAGPQADPPLASALTGLGLTLVAVDRDRALDILNEALARFERLRGLPEASPGAGGGRARGKVRRTSSPPRSAAPSGLHRPGTGWETGPTALALRSGSQTILGASPAERQILALEMVAFLEDQEGRTQRAAVACHRLVRDRGLDWLWPSSTGRPSLEADPVAPKALPTDRQAARRRAREVADAWWYRGLVSSEPQGRLAAFDTAIALYEGLPGPPTPDLRERLMMVFLARAATLERAQGPAAAVASYDRAIRIMLGLLGPARGHASEPLAHALEDRARALGQRGDREGAQTMLDSAVDVPESLVAQGRDDLRPRLAGVLLSAAEAALQVHRPRRAVGLCRQTVAVCGDSPELEELAARAWAQASRALARLKDPAERNHARERAISLHESLLDRGVETVQAELATLWTEAARDEADHAALLRAATRAVELHQRSGGDVSPVEERALALALKVGALGLGDEVARARATVLELLSVCDAAESEDEAAVAVRKAAQRFLDSPGDTKRRTGLLRRVRALVDGRAPPG